MVDPYRGVPRVVATEVRSPLDDFLDRLRQLGATPDEMDAVARTWDQLDPDDSPDPDAWTRARREEVRRAGDDYLRALILEGRAEYEYGTTTEKDAAAKAAHAAYAAALAEAQGRIGGTVPAVLAWVGDDPLRAEAVLHLETLPEGANRKSLAAPLRDLVGV